MSSVISVENLSKVYRLGQIGTGTISNDLKVWWARARGRPNPLLKIGDYDHGNQEGEDLWALRDVSFTVAQGEVLGIVGRNGAGKSTLLKILSRVTAPTSGLIKVKGRVGALLEVGTGFHPELTGRENIFLNGAILGMDRVEIRRKLDEIIAFAEIEAFLDTPVKRYSSGMYVRLAFAVAAHLEPEILLVDEVLAVGDAQFQKKCLGKIGEVADEGRTVLFVSHNMQAISALTRRVIILKQGRCTGDGPTQEGVIEYLHENHHARLYTDHPSSTGPKVTEVRLKTSHPGNVQQVLRPMEIQFEITTPAPIKGAALSFQVFNHLGQPALHVLTLDEELPLCREAGIYTLTCTIPVLHLYIGQYMLTVHLSEHKGRAKFQTIENICPFEVSVFGELRDYYWAPGTCAYLEEHSWHVVKKAGFEAVRA